MEQATALNILKSGFNVFITGSAGTGKTYLLNQYIQYLKERQVIPAIVAPTGIAASHLKGQTIHSFFGIGIREVVEDGFIEVLLQRKYLRTRFNALDILIIDEISMVSPELFSSMDRVLQAFKNSSKPFGGVQVIASGDFFQLPPISKVPKEKRFAWQSPSWRDLDFRTCYLEVKFRQDDDKLIRVLDDIRRGVISELSYQILNDRHLRELNTDYKPTRLYTHNLDVDRINSLELEKITLPPRDYSHISRGSKKNIEKIFNSSLVLENLSLKKGAVVIFIKNSLEQGYVNGTTGVVVGFSKSDGMPIVKTSSGKKIFVGLDEWSIENEDGEIIATISQVPLRLAWAITIHKSQGMTLDAAEIDLGRTFEVGQGYVALSRIKNIDGLRLMGLNDMALTVDPLILKIDDRIKSASQRAKKEVEAFLNLDKIQRNHILASGGTIDESNIRDDRKRKFAIKDKKIPTHIQTKNLIDKVDSIKEIAKARGVTEKTIVGHLSKLKKQDSSLDLSKFKLDSKNFEITISNIKKIKATKNEKYFTEEGRLKLQEVFHGLNREVSYNEIRLAILFV
ncbi:AAA family ATPase [Sulfurovum sp. bin170]|uniref:AAA family ATPase n=1 Tax=Sulfurovum sp. bin170 TaxID=2695268 RepID=UPI0013E0C527|nr:AAA family ATPase [Sulfurovum sp. bin170]NEW61523.1 AAA family ATPase [Sulfurovum sp. bin170]